MSSADYATLEEAFGVVSFLAPEPPILRGDVANVSDARHKNMKKEIQTSYVTPKPTPLCHRLPEDSERCPAGVPCDVEKKASSKESISKAHAIGGAEAAWKLIPDGCRQDMMWYAVRQCVDSDFTVMLFLAVCLYILFK